MGQRVFCDLFDIFSSGEHKAMNIELRGISKRFGSVQANKNISLDIRAGEVLGLLGENGAGKSTLMNVLSGLYQPDSGDILIDGAPVTFDGPGDSIAAGIGMVHQHFMLVPVFSVVENVILGVEPTGSADFLDLAAARDQVQAINARYGMDVPQRCADRGTARGHPATCRDSESAVPVGRCAYP
jgi:simple sugar transport system ATP-binding protein